MVGFTHDLIEQHCLDLQFVEGAQVRRAKDGFLWVNTTEDVHSRLLHHREQLLIVTGPPHVPDVLPLEAQPLASLGGFDRAVGAGADAVKQQHTVDIDDGQAAGRAV